VWRGCLESALPPAEPPGRLALHVDAAGNAPSAMATRGERCRRPPTLSRMSTCRSRSHSGHFEHDRQQTAALIRPFGPIVAHARA
jgi:hypothetical protein